MRVVLQRNKKKNQVTPIICKCMKLHLRFVFLRNTLWHCSLLVMCMCDLGGNKLKRGVEKMELLLVRNASQLRGM